MSSGVSASIIAVSASQAWRRYCCFSRIAAISFWAMFQ